MRPRNNMFLGLVFVLFIGKTPDINRASLVELFTVHGKRLHA